MKNSKIIIADSDKSFTDSILTSIDFESLHMNVACICFNGNNLLKQISFYQPDIIIIQHDFSDINVFQLMQSLRDSGYKCRFIITSENASYSLLHTALKLHADDFLLKPLDMKQLYETLQNLEKELKLEQIAKSKLKATTDRHFFLSVEVDKLSSASSIHQINQIYGTNFHNGIFQFFIIKLDTPRDILNIYNNFPYQDILMNIVPQYLENFTFDFIYDKMTDGLLILVNYSTECEDEITKRIDSIFTDMQHILKNDAGIQVSLFIGRKYLDISALPVAKSEILDARWVMTEKRSGNIINSSKNTFITCPSSVQHQMTELIVNVGHFYEVLDVSNVLFYFSSFCDTAFSYLNAKESRIFFKKMIKQILKTYTSLVPSALDAEDIRMEFNYLLNTVTTIDKKKKLLMERLRNLLHKTSQFVNTQYTQIIQDAIDYIHKNIDRSISLTEIAQEVHLSPAYFSSQFKKETQKNFSEYLISCKIDFAKELLKNTTKSISDICYKVGYNDVKYFSKLFKKNVQISPSEYRKLYQINTGLN
jgi:two-component system response regulator YesN